VFLRELMCDGQKEKGGEERRRETKLGVKLVKIEKSKNHFQSTYTSDSNPAHREQQFKHINA